MADSDPAYTTPYAGSSFIAQATNTGVQSTGGLHVSLREDGSILLCVSRSEFGGSMTGDIELSAEDVQRFYTWLAQHGARK